MEPGTLRTLLETGETDRLELKENAGGLRDIKRTLCAFANDFAEVGGGLVVVGVSDDKQVLGVSDPDEVQRFLAQHAKECDPPVHVRIEPVELALRKVVVGEVAHSSLRPHSTGGACYVRVGSITRAASMGEIEDLLRRRRQSTPTEDEPVLKASPDDMDFDAFDRYLRARPRSDLRNGHSLQELAQTTGWLVKSADGAWHPSVAAMLLFGKEPERFLPQTGIEFARFLGEDRAADVRDRQTFVGTLADCVQRCLQKVVDLSMRGFEFESQSPIRRDLEEYPLLVVREALVNALVHRDYAHRTSRVNVWMFDDRIEVQSPGGLFGRVTKENFGNTVDYRNRKLAEAFYLFTRLIEMMGRGVPFMYKTMASNGSAPPQFVFDPQYVHVVLPGQPMYFARRLYQLATAQLSEHEPQKAVAHLQKALAMAPKIPELHVAIGIAYRSQGLLGEAKNELEHALKLDPGLAAAYIELAQLQTELGQIEAAKMTLSMGVRLARERSEILRHAARLELQQGAHEKAFGLLESAKTLAPRDWTLLAEYGSMAMRLGRYELAHEALKTACEAGGPGVSVSQLQALLDAQVHTDTLPEEVEHTFSRILALQPRQQAAYQAFFNYLSRKGLADRALQISEEARQQGFSVSIEAAHRKEQVFLGGLPMGTNSEELRGWLKNRVVQPETLEMKNDKGGYPFAVLHVNAEEVARTIEQLDGAMWKGRRLRSSLFRSGTDRPRRKPHRNETK